MAAQDTFTHAVNTLPQREREHLADLIATVRQDIFAARSEEARVRLVDSFITEVHDRRPGTKH